MKKKCTYHIEQEHYEKLKRYSLKLQEETGLFISASDVIDMLIEKVDLEKTLSEHDIERIKEYKENHK